MSEALPYNYDQIYANKLHLCVTNATTAMAHLLNIN